MDDVSFTGLFVVAAVGFTAPLLLGLAPGLRIPAVVLELIGGILVGPSVLGWVEPDTALEVLSLLGLAFLLLLAGLEIDFERLRGRLPGITSAAFALSLGIALAAGLALDVTRLVRSPLLVAIMLAATSLGGVVPDIGSIVLLSLFFSGESSGLGAQLVLLGGFGLLVCLLALVLVGIERWMRLAQALLRLQDTTAQIRVRGVFVLLALFVAFAEGFGLLRDKRRQVRPRCATRRGAALVTAGLASVLLFPPTALVLLSGASRSETPRAASARRPPESRPA